MSWMHHYHQAIWPALDVDLEFVVADVVGYWDSAAENLQPFGHLEEVRYSPRVAQVALEGAAIAVWNVPLAQQLRQRSEFA